MLLDNVEPRRGKSDPGPAGSSRGRPGWRDRVRVRARSAEERPAPNAPRRRGRGRRRCRNRTRRSCDRRGPAAKEPGVAGRSRRSQSSPRARAGSQSGLAGDRRESGAAAIQSAGNGSPSRARGDLARRAAARLQQVRPGSAF